MEVGDVVRVKDWETLVKEFGLYHEEYIKGYVILKKSEGIAGQIGIVETVREALIDVRINGRTVVLDPRYLEEWTQNIKNIHINKERINIHMRDGTETIPINGEEWVDIINLLENIRRKKK